MKKMKKKIWACLMALAMVLTMLPGMAVKAEAATSYEVWIGDMEVTSDCTSGDGWSYDAKTNTLTLDGFSYTGVGTRASESGSAGVILAEMYTPLNLVLKGDNYIEKEDSPKHGWNCGIACRNLIIRGNGSLTVKGGTSSTSHGISGTNLTVESGKVIAVGRASAGSSGIYMGSNVIVNGGEISASADNSTSSISRGIECSGTFTMNGGKVTATATGVKSTGYGIEAYKGITHAGGYLTAEGDTQALKISNSSYDKKDAYPNGYNGEKTYSKIAKKTLTAADFTFTAPGNLIYDGKGKEAEIEFNGVGSCGAMNVTYYDADGHLMNSLPTEIGTYTVKLNVAENDTYAEAKDLTDPSWKFEIVYGEATSDMYSVSGINEAGWANEKVTITGEEWYKVKKAESGSFEKSMEIAGSETADGKVDIFVQETATGKVYRGSVGYKLDKTAPVIEGLEDGKTYCLSSKFSVSDVLSGLADVKDGETSLGADGTYTLTAGTHTITVTDVAGNSSTVTVKVEGTHEYASVDYSWNEDYTECTASAVCKNCGQKASEKATVTSAVTQKQTCELQEKTTYTATFKDAAFATQTKEVKTKDALGHTPKKDDGDCTTAVTCVRCDYVFVAAKEHNFGGEMQKDASGHWTVCQNEGCTQVNKEAHTPDIAAPTEDQDQQCKECGFIIANKLGHQHKLHLEYRKAKSATCTADGNKAYYICSEDGHCFTDENAENPVNVSDMAIAATGHDYGNPAYTWNEDNTICTATLKCKTCQDVKEKEEVQATLEVTQKQSCTEAEITTYTATFTNSAFAVQKKEVQTKEAAGHVAGDWIVDKDATVAEAGSQHKECTVCGTVVETETIAKLPMIAYKIIEGADGTYTLNTDGTYTVRANGEFSKFVSVEMDGKVVDSKNYTAKSGSTIITFSKEYMSSLTVGKHTVKVNFEDGSAETTLTVVQKDVKKNTDGKDTGKKADSNSVKTGDNSNMIAWFILLVASACIVGSLREIRRQRRR